MRSLAACLLAALLLLTLPGAGLSARVAAPPSLLTGALSAADGRPTAGRLLLFHDNLRDHDRLELVATARASANGRFELRLAPSRSTRSAAARNDGFVNFALYGVSREAASSLRFFSARQDGRGAWQGRATDLSGLVVKLGRKPPAPDFAEKLEAGLGASPAQAARAGTVQASGAAWLDDCYYDLLRTFDRGTPVLELHTWYGDLLGKASYGETRTADSDVTVGVRYGDVFSMEGTTHIGNTQTVTAALSRTGRFGRVLQSEFRYKHWRVRTPNNFICGAAPHEIVEAVRWNGTGLLPMWDDSRFDGQCTTTYRANRAALSRNAEWSRWSEELTAYQWNLHVAAGLTVAMRARSGASSRVGYEYTTGSARSIYYLCGNDEKPAFSRRIFAGH